MIVYVALDNNNGMMFNNRRQSQDKLLRSDLMSDVENSNLWISSYSAKLFSSDFPDGLPSNILVDDNFLKKAASDDVCFVEEFALSEHINNIQKLVIYKWNRVYPADLCFDLDLSSDNWVNASITEFVGNSHEKITKEVWKLKC